MSEAIKSGTLTGMLLVLISALLGTVSCKKEPEPEKLKPTESVSYSTYMYILNEGLFNMNNATLTKYGFADSTVETDCFFNINGRGLGDTGSDIGIYGSKMYVVVNVSSQVEVMDAATCKSLRQIPLFDGKKPRQPRKLTFSANYAFICNFDGTVAVIDTSSLEIVKMIAVGRNPDGICSAYGKIWVSNSGGLSFPDYDNTISVVDPVTLTETRKITVGMNPFTLRSDNHDNIYLISRGNYSDIKSRLQVANANSGTVVKTFDEFEALNFCISGDSAFVYNYNWTTGQSSIYIINTGTQQIVNEQFVSDGTYIRSVYGIASDPGNRLIYITDAGNFTGRGKVHAFSKEGKLQYTFNTGINPAGMAFFVKN